jgi:hypothetical protein
MGPLDNSAIADTVAAVLHSRPFVESGRISIGQIVTQWLWNIVMRLFGFAASHPAVGFVLRLTLGVITLIVLARIVFGLFVRYSPSSSVRQRLDVSRGTDWWSRAQYLAATDDYTGAAHALYLALLGSVARRGLVSLHESKTTGDYLRELRRKPDSVNLPLFTDFTRSYETVIYGIGTCDQQRYDRLNTLASGILGSNAHLHGSRS